MAARHDGRDGSRLPQRVSVECRSRGEAGQLRQLKCSHLLNPLREHSDEAFILLAADMEHIHEDVILQDLIAIDDGDV